MAVFYVPKTYINHTLKINNKLFGGFRMLLHICHMLQPNISKLLPRAVIKFRGDASYRDIANITGIHASTLCRIEKGQVPDLLTYVKLCSWMKVTLECWIEYKETKTKKK